MRFAWDSLYERACKLLHLGIMIGFAISGPGYTLDRGAPADNFVTMRRITVILMTSRLVLAAQYAVLLLFARRQDADVWRPLVWNMGTLLVVAAIFGGLFGVFNEGDMRPGYLGFYVTFVFEVVVFFTVSVC